MKGQVLFQLLRLRSWYLQTTDLTKILVLLGVITLIGVGFFPRSESAAEPAKVEPQSVDTFIPAGFVLVPIEIENQSALDGIIGNAAIVNLFPVARQGEKRNRRPVAEHVRLLRAPLNPSQFAVLVDENLAPELVRQEGPFFVMIENPKSQRGAVVRSGATKQKGRVEYATME